MSDPSPNPATPSPQKIGNYPIDKELGRGGMGVVYLARDPRLNRPVAIKVLPAAFVADPLRLQRFEREARTLAALNHKNVAMIFGLEESDGQRLLVLEFVPGQTLTQRLSRGPLPLDECLRTCIQIAEGLEAAHERDVVHRDLKPDNLKITPDGLVKVLDFGLATQQTPHADSDAATATGSALTMAGMVMGTPGYMSPEQARGMPTDKRADIWALGCVLYEMLTGYKAFYGETVSDCIAAILEHEPDFGHLPARTPNRLRDILRKCFVKDARRRMRDIGDVRIELEDILVQPQSGWYQAAGVTAARPAATARLVMPLAPSSSPGASAGTPAEIVLANSARSALAVAPDGSAVAFIAGRPPSTQLWLRRMDALEARPVPGTQGADAPFFSPDSTKVAFFAEGKLKRVALSGGAPFPIAAAPRHQGGCWDSADSIAFIPDWQKPLLKIPGAGGVLETVVQPDMAAGEIALLTPEILPGSRHALVTVWTGSTYDDALITAIDLRSGARKPLIHGGGNPKYLPSGHILYSRAGTLMAVAFDADKVEVFGSPIAVEDRIMGNALGGSSQFAAGADGTLVFAVGAVYEPTSAPCLTLKAGDPVPVTPDRKPFAAPRIAPNGRFLCVQVQGVADHLFLYDLERSGSPGIRLTFQGDNAAPVWSPDGTRIAFRSTLSGRPEIVQIRVDPSGAPSGAQTPEVIHHTDAAAALPTPCCFVGPDGRTLVFTQNRAAPATGLEIWAVDIGNPTSARAIIQSPASAWGAAVSPDGRHIAYVSDETGRAEVYVQPFGTSGSGGGPRRQVSTEGGAAPVWARNGGELFFRSGDNIIAVRIAVEPSFMVGRPRTLFQGAALAPTLHTPNYDVLADGQFLILRAADDPTHVTALSVILNFFTELRRRVPPPIPQSAAMPTRMSQMSYGPTAAPSRATPNAPHATPRPQQAFPSDMKTIG